MLDLKIMPDDGEPYDLKVTTRDIARWEKTAKGASFSRLQNEMRVTDVYAVAFHAATRQGLYSGTLAEFSECVDFDIVDEDAEADPTQSAAS